MINFGPLSLVAWSCRILIVGNVSIVTERLKLFVLSRINDELVVIPFAVSRSAS